MIVPSWTKKRSLFVATIFIVLFGSVIYVQGYGTGQATLFGHSAEEVDVMYGGRLVTLHRALYEIEQAIIALTGGDPNMTSYPLDPAGGSGGSSSHAGLQSMEGKVYITAQEGRRCWFYVEFDEQLVFPYTQTSHPCGGQGCLRSSRLHAANNPEACHGHVQWFLRDTLTKDFVSEEIAGMPVSYFAIEDYTIPGGINPATRMEATFTFKYAMTTDTPGERFEFSCSPTEDAYQANGASILCAATGISYSTFRRCCERSGALGPWPRYV